MKYWQADKTRRPGAALLHPARGLATVARSLAQAIYRLYVPAW